MSEDCFTFKHFIVRQGACGMKVGTDGTLLGAWADGGSRILDIGTGTGLIAMMMAQRFPESFVEAVDMDVDACRQAMSNVEDSTFAGQIKVSACRLQDYHPQHTFDSIVSNPPFFIDSLKCPDAKRAAARHADTLPFVDLFQCVGRLLSADGRFSVIVPIECMGHLLVESYMVGLYVVRRCSVRTVPRKHPKRVLLSFARQHVDIVENEEVTLMNNLGQRTEWYSELTKEFYVR